MSSVSVFEFDDVCRVEFRLRRGFGRSGSDWGHLEMMGMVVVTKREGDFSSDPSHEWRELPFEPDPIGHIGKSPARLSARTRQNA